MTYSVDNPHPDDLGHRAYLDAYHPGESLAYRVMHDGKWRVRYRDGALLPAALTDPQVAKFVLEGTLLEFTP